MEKKKIYIFVGYSIRTVGGSELYILGKGRYLKSLGWKVYTFFYNSYKNSDFFSSFDGCLDGIAGCYFLSEPPYRFTSSEQDMFLDLIIQKAKLTDFEDCDIIVESLVRCTAYWGELLAARIGARHFFCALEENFRYPNSHFEDNLDFFYFKWKRNEIICGNDSMKRLLNGYKGVTGALKEIPDTVREQDAIKDVDFPEINNVTKLDWNICHIGRFEKEYVGYVVYGVVELAKRYPNKKINFIFVGYIEKITLTFLNKTFENISNVTLTFLGLLVPIPKILFSKVDVVCAISQTARFTANEGVLTIVGSADTPEKTPGVLGYDTEEQLFGDPNFSYFEVLENVLEKRLYDNKTYSLPKLLPAEHYYEKFWTILKNAEPSKEYFVQRLTQSRVRNWTAVFPFSQIARGTRIILVGATEIAFDYRRQVETQKTIVATDSEHIHNTQIEISPNGIRTLEEQPYCHIVAIVDEHPENFDDEILGFERLKTIDYDAILITSYHKKTKETLKKILDIVPQMADRVICNLKFVDVYRLEHKQVKLFEF